VTIGSASGTKLPTRNLRPSATEDFIELERIVLPKDHCLYIRSAWPVVEPSTTYLENSHIYLIAEQSRGGDGRANHAAAEQHTTQYMKSACVLVIWPRWVMDARGVGGV
jgi:hypothetical protein